MKTKLLIILSLVLAINAHAGSATWNLNPTNGDSFSNLADGAVVNVNGNNLQASYSGGDGNDLTLTVVP